MISFGTPAIHDAPIPREQRIEAAEDRAEQASYDAWREAR